MSDATAPATAWADIRLPHLGWRALVGVLLFVVYALLLVAGPLYVLGLVTAHGVVVGASVLEIEIGGVTLAALGATAYVVRPTRAYGPALLGRAAVGVVYLLLLAPAAYVSLHLGGAGSLTLGGSELVLWLAVVPMVSFVAALFVTISDERDPTVRLRREFPGAIDRAASSRP